MKTTLTIKGDNMKERIYTCSSCGYVGLMEHEEHAIMADVYPGQCPNCHHWHDTERISEYLNQTRSA